MWRGEALNFIKLWLEEENACSTVEEGGDILSTQEECAGNYVYSIIFMHIKAY